MRNISKVLAVVAVLAAVAIVFSVTRMGKRSGSSSIVAEPNEDQTSTQEMADASPGTTSSLKHVIRRIPPSQSLPPNALGSSATNDSAASSGIIADWEDKVDGILSPEGDEKEKAQK